ncbi:MAG: response regulator [Spirochaeta sp.]
MSQQAILCVDDEMIILMAMVQELKRTFGDRFQYEQETNAEDALLTIDELAQEGVEVIIILSDWLMPNMKGDEFIDIVSQRYPHIKMIMITGHADQQVIEKVKKNDTVLSVLGKPWRSAELSGIISEYLLQRN